MEQLAAILPKEQLPALGELKTYWKNLAIGTLGTTEWKGHRFQPGFNTECMKYAYEEWEMPENAVFIQSFPKTGLNWTGEILRQIIYGRDEKLEQLTKPISIMLSMMNMGPVSNFKMFDNLPLPRRFFTSHLLEELFNFEKMKKKNGKMIYLIRNPKDQAVSFFHFAGTVPVSEDLKASVDAGWDTYIDDYMHGKITVFSKPGEWYPEHIRGWLKRRDDKDFLLLVFEEMKKDLPKEIHRIAKFIDVKLTDDEVKQIADICSFTSMKKALKDDPVRKSEKFARKGEVGGWKDHFTVAQSEMMDKIIEERMGDTGIQFIYNL